MLEIVTVRIQKHPHKIRIYDFGFRLIKFLFTGCLVRNQPENVLQMFLKFVSEILYIIHC